jgi:Fe-S-cluster-containing dehydrogenase component
MKKCTLCVDRIYNDHLAEEDRVPACVAACPTSARHFGDLGDPTSAISQLVEERSGVALMPELGYKPTNRYLPPRARSEWAAKVDAPALEPIRAKGGFLGWIDRMLSN